MFRLFSNLLDKMGNWFGIIFKIILPIIIMYYPIKLSAYTVFIYGTVLGGDFNSFDGLRTIVCFLLYAVFVLMVFLFPKVASGIEFVLIPYYFVTLILCTCVEFFTLHLSELDAVLSEYARFVPVVALFLACKILFYIFIRTNQDKIEEGRREKFKNREGLR